jgi:Fe-S cluster assembly ATP-binding protein
LLDELRPDHIHVLIDGRIVESGGMEIAERLERDGYEFFREPALAASAASEPGK